MTERSKRVVAWMPIPYNPNLYKNMSINNFVYNFNAPVGEMIIDNEWIKIERDKDGFATTECLNFMFSKLPFVVVGKDSHGFIFYEVVSEFDYRGDIERHTKYTHYLLIPKWSDERSKHNYQRS